MCRVAAHSPVLVAACTGVLQREEFLALGINLWDRCFEVLVIKSRDVIRRVAARAALHAGHMSSRQ